MLLLLAGELAAVALLVRVGRREPFVIPVDDLRRWARTADPVDAVAAVIRLVALVAATWLLVTTLLYVVARAADIPRALRTLERVTPPGARRVVDRALVMMAVGVFVAPAGATVVTVRDGRSGSSATAPSTTTTSRAPTPTTPTSAQPGAVPVAVVPRTAATPAAATTVVVRPGDNLWALAADHLAATTGRARPTLDNTEIARYWAAVCDANRARVRSGNVNLIYPGDVILLPAIS